MFTQSVFSVAYQMPDHNDNALSQDSPDISLQVIKEESFFHREWTDAQAAIKKFVLKHKNPNAIIMEANFLNTARLFWNFYTKFLLSVLNAIKVPDANQIKNTLDWPSELFEFLGVAVFVVRFLAHLIEILSLANDKEKFLEALSARGLLMVRDLAWATINLFINYGKYFSVDLKDAFISLFDFSIRVTGVLSVAGLLFDITINLVQWLCIDRLKYNRDRKELESKADTEGLAELKIAWQQKQFRNICVLMVLSVTVIGVSAALILTGGLALPICNAAVFLAVAFSRTIDSFTHFQKSRQVLRLNDSEDNKELYKQSRNTLALNIVKNVVIPALVIGVCVASWQAALVCVAVFLLFNIAKKMTHHFFKPAPLLADLKTRPSQEVSQEANNAVVDNVIDVDPGLEVGLEPLAI